MNYPVPRRRFDGFNQLLDSFFDMRSWDAVINPPLADLEDRGDHYQLIAEFPGVRREDLDIQVTETSVHLRAANDHREEMSNGNFLRRERHSGSFQRTFSLPSPVSPEEARARFRNGVLTIDLPKERGARGINLQIDE